MPILAIIQLMGKHWKLVAGLVFAVISFGCGYSMASDKCARDNMSAALAFNEQANAKAKEYEAAIKTLKAKRSTTQERIHETSKPSYSCIIPTRGVQLLQASISNTR